MCFGAIYWSRIRAVYFGAERGDAANIGFDDSLIYEEVKRDIGENARIVPFKQVLREKALCVFEAWNRNQNRKMY